jgi:inorganic pyrophosphatase
MRLKVFIQNEAGSNQKHYHDEKTLRWERVVRVSRAYPYPYGFVIGTTSPDGCNVDCFVLTTRSLRTGEVADCEIVGLMEQVEDGVVDHNVVARFHGEAASVNDAVRLELTEFVQHVFDHIQGKRISVGRFLGPREAEEYVLAHMDHG